MHFAGQRPIASCITHQYSQEKVDDKLVSLSVPNGGCSESRATYVFGRYFALIEETAWNDSKCCGSKIVVITEAERMSMPLGSRALLAPT